MLILTGASSTGKTTVAYALQRLAPTPAVVLSADQHDLPTDARALLAVRAQGPAAVATLQRALFTAFYEGCARWPAHGVTAIVETIFRDAEQLAICRDTLAAVPHVVVRLVCDRAVRLARERQRRDRQPGVSEASAHAEIIPADLAATLDTTATAPDDLATALLPFL